MATVREVATSWAKWEKTRKIFKIKTRVYSRGRKLLCLVGKTVSRENNIHNLTIAVACLSRDTVLGKESQIIYNHLLKFIGENSPN